MQGTTFGLTPLEGTQEMIKRIQKIYPITTDSVFLDVGSGDGTVVFDFQAQTGIIRSIGVEMQQVWHDKAIKQYPEMELYCDRIENRLDLIKKANIIYFNNICIPEKVFWECFDIMKKGTVIIQNKQSIGSKLKKLGYTYTSFYMSANNMNKETQILRK